MTNRYPWVARAFGDNAVTVWSWLLILPFAVTVMAGYEFVTGGQPVYRTLLVALTVHVLLGLVLLVARFTVLRPGYAHHRALSALALFVGIGAVRPFLTLWIAVPFGVSVVTGDLVSRITINVVSAVVFLPLIAIVVDVLRHHGEVQRHLVAARSAVEQRRADANLRVDDLREEFAATVAARIDEAIASVGGDLEPERAAQLLQRISDDIVRPTSHALFRDDSMVEPPPEVAHPVGLVVRLRRVASGLQPAPPLVVAAVYLTLVFPHFLTTYGPVVPLLQTPVIAAIYLMGNTATRAICSRIDVAIWRILALLACYIGVAALAAAQNSFALSLFGYSAEFYWAELVSYPFVAMVIAVILSVSTQLHEDEDSLAISLREQVQLASRAQNRLTDVRRRMAHLLHSTVQAELVAASLALRHNATADSGRPLDAGAVVANTVAEIKRELIARATVGPPPAREGIGGIIAMWGTALRIDVTIDDDVWPILDADPARLTSVIDVLSEGFTNAVRHGTGTAVSLSIRPVSDRETVVVEIRSLGALAKETHTSEGGIGLAGLRASVAHMSIRTDSEHVVLTVTLA